MTSPSLSHALSHSLQGLPFDAPWRANFFTTLRRLSASDRQKPLPGAALKVSDENFRLSQAVSLAFPASEIASLAVQDNRLAVKLFSLGVWGPQGPLPLHYSELALSRFLQQDTALVDFIDLFHHRCMAIFFRAWYAAQDTASLDRPEQDRFSHYIHCLSGSDLLPINAATLTRHERLSASFHLARKHCSPDDLVAALRALFHLPFHIEEFQRGWIKVAPNEQTDLGRHSHTSSLGHGAMLGEASYQASHKFKVWCGPLSHEQYLSLHPENERLSRISDAIQRLSGGYLHFEIQLMLAATTSPQLRLSGGEQLGFDTWLGDEKNHSSRLGMIFEPQPSQIND